MYTPTNTGMAMKPMDPTNSRMITVDGYAVASLATMPANAVDRANVMAAQHKASRNDAE